MTQVPPDLFDDGDLDAAVADAVRRIALGGFRALWCGRAVTLTELVGGGDPAVLGQAADHLRARGRIELADDGVVVAVHGLAHRPTPHRIEHDGGVVNTWCALDAIGIPAALVIDARAVTWCPTCGTELAVPIRAGEPQPLEGAVLWYPESTCRHLVDDFCSSANLFCSPLHIEQWTDCRPGAGRIMTTAEVAEVGRACWADAASHLRAEASG